LPEAVRGKSIDGMIHIADWYATFASLAGVDPTDKPAAKAGLPAIDSIDMSHMITGVNSTSPRTELPLSYAYSDDGTPPEYKALIDGRYKLLFEQKPISNAEIPGVTTPNGTAIKTHVDCSAGCLFDLEADYVEHYDIASNKAEIVASMSKRLDEIGKTVYQSPGGSGIEDAKAMEAEALKGEEESIKAYEEYVTATNDSIEAKVKEIAEKEAIKADLEAELVETEAQKTEVLRELEELAAYNAELHKSCDFVLKNFEVRQTARDQEIEALKQAKAILSGAKFEEFLQAR